MRSGSYVPQDRYQPRGSRPWCPTCDSDEHLSVGTVTVLNCRQQTLAAVVDCAGCHGSWVLATTASFVTAQSRRL
jgi:hypothetical protein